MAVLKNRAKMSTSTTGTGTITLGSVESGYQTFADAGVANADVVRYVIEDGNNFEIGTGTYTATGTTLSRTVSESSNSDAAINLSGSATVFIGATAEDIPALYAENESSPAAQPSATGTNSISIGDSATSSTTHAIAIGHGAKALGGDRAMALGRSYASGEDAFAAAIDDITGTHGAKAQHAVAIGKEALADGQSTLALGRDATATSGVYAAAIGRAYSSGADSFAAAIGNNTSSYGAQSNNGIAMGMQAKAHDSQYSIAIGRNNISSGGSGCTVIGGQNNEATATSSIITGGAYCSITGAAQYARAGGGYSKASVHGQDVFASGQFSSVGDAQGAKYILRADTTDATATVLTTSNGNPANWNQIVAASDTCIMFSGTLVAMQNGTQDQGGWEIKGLLKNDGGTTTLVSSNIQTFADGNGWVVALTADNTNNALAITCTGEAAHNIRWVANIQTSEVTYA